MSEQGAASRRLLRLRGVLRHGRGTLGSVRAQLFTIVLACVAPATIAATWALASAYHVMYEALSEQARANSRAMARTVDGVISTSISRLQALATSSELESDDIAGFDAIARRVQPFLSGTNLVLTDATGRQRVNTALPRDAPLPMHGNLEFQRRVLRTGRPAVSDLFVGSALKRPLIVMEVPVRPDKGIPYTLAMGFLPDRFARIVTGQQTQPDWVVSIFDSTGTIIARTHEADRFVGHQGAPALLAAMARSPQGIVETTTLEGIPVIAAYTRSEVAHWTVAVGIPEALLTGELKRWIGWLVAFSAGMLAVGLVLAQAVSARIAGAIGALVEPARALGQGEPAQPMALPVAEAQVVADALVHASRLIRVRTRQRDQATQARQEIQEQAAAFQHAAAHDPLTGLPNRARFTSALQDLVDRHTAAGGVFAVLFIDVDDFKPVNDAHGHAVGDDLLCAFAARLRSGFRERDLVARLAGDEFAALIDDHTARELEAPARAILESLARPYGVGELTVRVSASMGGATFPVDGRDARSLLDAADAAMYRAKAAGKGTYSIIEPGARACRRAG